MKQHDCDRMETLPCGSLIQHGQYNNRIYLMKTGANASPELPASLIAMAEKYGYTKIFAKVPSDKADDFTRAGFRVEATVPGFYNGLTAGLFLAYYLDEKRVCEFEAGATYEQNMLLTTNKGKTLIQALDAGKFLLRPCVEGDVAQMAEIYKIVFASYPFPIHNPEYLLETMRHHIDYFCVETTGKIVALSSAEKDQEASNLEMTDFATLPQWRGNGLGVHLLKYMEIEGKKNGIKTAYTIARAASAGMNITFAKLDYNFGGRLKNNTNISGKIESMNVWHKPIL